MRPSASTSPTRSSGTSSPASCWSIGAWLALNLYDSPTGRALRALHGSEIAARTVGIDVARLKLQAFVISAVYASLSGSLLALQNKFITPDVAGFMHSIEMVTMAVLGGVGSVLGAFFGAAILTTLPQVLTVFQEYEQILLGLVMMLVHDLHARRAAPEHPARRSGGRTNDHAPRSRQGLGITFGGLQGRPRRRASASSPARSSRSSARTAPARPRSST